MCYGFLILFFNFLTPNFQVNWLRVFVVLSRQRLPTTVNNLLMIEIYQNGFQGCALNYKENSEPNVTRIERSGTMNTNFSRRFLGCEPYFLTWLGKYLSIVHSKDLQAFTTSKYFFCLVWLKEYRSHVKTAVGLTMY